MDKLYDEARNAESPEELFEIARNENIKLSKEEAVELYGRLHASGCVDDDDLDSVTGGACGKGNTLACPRCSSPLTGVSYHDRVDNTDRTYYLCYGCRCYGAVLNAGTLWPLEENFVSWILDKSVKV